MKGFSIVTSSTQRKDLTYTMNRSVLECETDGHRLTSPRHITLAHITYHCDGTLTHITSHCNGTDKGLVSYMFALPTVGHPQSFAIQIEGELAIFRTSYMSILTVPIRLSTDLCLCIITRYRNTVVCNTD